VNGFVSTIDLVIGVALSWQYAFGEQPPEPTTALQSKAVSTPDTTKLDDLQVSPWSQAVRGLQCRIHLPRSIEQGLPLPVTVDFRKGVTPPIPSGDEGYIQVFDKYFSLILSRDGSKSEHILESNNYDPGMPVIWSPHCKHYTRQITRQAIAPVPHSFHLARLGEQLRPGVYSCRVRLQSPDVPRDCSKQWEDGKPDPRYWGGELSSDAVKLEILAEKPKTKESLLPKRLRLLRQSFPKSKPYLVVNYTDEDAERLVFKIRNGYHVGTSHTESKDGVFVSGGLHGGPPHAGTSSATIQLHNYKGGPIKLTVEMELFETCESTGHFWSPGNCGYKTLWKRTFEVEYTEEEAKAILNGSN